MREGDKKELKSCLFDPIPQEIRFILLTGRQLCEVCDCRDRLVDCSNAKLHFVPWVPEDFDEADVLRYVRTGKS